MAEILERTESSYFNSFKILFQDVVNGKSIINCQAPPERSDLWSVSLIWKITMGLYHFFIDSVERSTGDHDVLEAPEMHSGSGGGGRVRPSGASPGAPSTYPLSSLGSQRPLPNAISHHRYSTGDLQPPHTTGEGRLGVVGKWRSK